MPEFKSLFDSSSVAPGQDGRGVNIEKYGGVDIPEGRGATRSEPDLPQVTFVNLPGAPGEGDTVGRTDQGIISGGTAVGLILKG